MFLLTLLATNLSGAGNEVRDGLADKIAGFFDYIISQIPSWIAGFIVFVLTIIVAKLAKSAVESRISDRVDEEHQEVIVLAGRVTFVGTLTVGITIALKIAGIDLTTILAAVAFGVGFALQDLIMNFLAGVMILMGRQITIGDFIKVGATTGRVMEIQSRATILKAGDGTKVIVPNAELFRSQVTSTTANPMRRLTIPLYISYDTDISYAMQVVLRIMKKHPKIFKKPAPSVIVQDYGDSSIDLSARCWVETKGWIKVQSGLKKLFLESFIDAGIVVPYTITHIETNQDTAADLKMMQERAQKKIAEMKARKQAKLAANGVAPAQAADNLAAVNGASDAGALQNGAAVAAVNGTTPSSVALDSNTPVQALTPAPEMATATVQSSLPVQPPGAYEDLMEIDENA